ncbi:MAG: hypothetical protein WC783_02895 [Candidatus Paceibacterota bacterium]|jgi:hypothetical protein
MTLAFNDFIGKDVWIYYIEYDDTRREAITLNDVITIGQDTFIVYNDREDCPSILNVRYLIKIKYYPPNEDDEEDEGDN